MENQEEPPAGADEAAVQRPRAAAAAARARAVVILARALQEELPPPPGGGVANEAEAQRPVARRVAVRAAAIMAARQRMQRHTERRAWLHRRRRRDLDPIMIMMEEEAAPRSEQQVRDEANIGHAGVTTILPPLASYREVFLLRSAICFMKNAEIHQEERRNVWIGLQLAQGRRRAESEASRPVTRRGVSSLRQEEHTFGRLAEFKMLQEPNDDTVEQVTTAPDFDPTQLFIKKCTACVGWAVHGLVFELVNGQRMGVLLGVTDRVPQFMNLDDTTISSRGGAGWTNIDHGDYIVAIHGNRLAAPYAWLCHSVVLEFHSGKIIRYESEHEPWRGVNFSYNIPQPSLVYRITFGHGQTRDARGVVTSVHLGISAENMQYLPPHYKQAVQDTFDILQKVDTTLYSSGNPSLGDDLWRNVLSFLAPWQLHVPPCPVRNVSALAQESFQVLEQQSWEQAMLHERLVHHGWNETAVQEAMFELTDLEQRLDAMAVTAVARRPR